MFFFFFLFKAGIKYWGRKEKKKKTKKKQTFSGLNCQIATLPQVVTDESPQVHNNDLLQAKIMNRAKELDFNKRQLRRKEVQQSYLRR